MAVSQAQIVDLLYKQAFGVTKTDTATNKSPSNEAIASPLLIRGDTQWTQSGSIPGTAGAVAGLVQAYGGVNAVQTSADTTTVPIGGIYPTWKTNLIYWIPSEFGSTYNVQVWVDNPGVANPTSTGTQIFADGSSGTGQYYYNYQSGVLNFIGETIPTVLTAGKVIYIVGYRYIGAVGVTNLPSGTIVGNLSFTGSNISSTGTNANINLTPNGLGNVVSSGNVYAPNFFGNLVGNISGNITIGGANTQLIFNDSGLANGNANLTFNKTTSLLTVAGILSVTGNTSIGGNINMNSQWINNVGYPSLSTDAASKQYVDTMSSTGLAYHQPVNVSTTTTLAVATGGTTAYNSPNGAANGIGAYISTTGTFLLIDSANVQTVGTRILVKDEANATWNGVYVFSNTTAITRSTDTDQYGPDATEQISINDYFFTLGGIVNEGTAFVVSAPAGNITFGTSNITFSVFSQSQVYDAGTGIAITGTTISANASQTQVTAVGTLTSLSVSGNANIGNIGTGGLITATGNITGANIITAGNVSAVGNGIFGNISTTGNISGANVVSTNTFTATANVTAGNLSTAGLITVTGNANIGNIGTGGLILAIGNVTGGNIVTGGVVTATGNVTGANIVAANGVYGITANFTGNLTSLNANLGNLVTANFVTIASNILTSNLTVNLALAGNTANFTGNLTSLNANLGNLATANFINVSSNLNVTNTANVGNLRTNNLLYANGQPWDLQEAAGSNRQIQFNDGNNNFAANANLTYDYVASNLTVVGNIIATSFVGNISGNIVIPGSNTGVVFNDSGNANSSTAFTFNKVSNVVALAGNLTLGTTTIATGTTTTSNVNANQTIVQFSTTGIAAMEFLVKGIDSTGSKYSVSTVTAVTNGTNVDYVTYATAFLNSTTGSLAVNVVGGNVALQVTPASSNSTVWTTQVRFI
jgi:hypothetical protein